MGKPVPERPFPWLNEKGKWVTKAREFQLKTLRFIVVNAGLMCCVLVVGWKL